jgi:hypothetical protein
LSSKAFADAQFELIVLDFKHIYGLAVFRRIEVRIMSVKNSMPHRRRLANGTETLFNIGLLFTSEEAC